MIPTHARAVVIGGGVSGASVLYHLAQMGWTDAILLERKRLTSGTTWHAAGLIGQLRGSANMTRLAKYSADLYTRLEAETGIATGMRQVGSVSVALTEHRREELLRQATVARIFDVEVHEITPSEAGALHPLLNLDGVTGAVHLPLDGQCDPANIAMALAKGARQRGARIAAGVRVTRVTQAAGRVTGVDWQAEDGTTGHIAAEVVVNCAGMWGRDLAAASGVTLPLHAAEHFYLVTEPIPDLAHLPVLRVPDECAYYKTDAGKLMLGAFEPVAKPWGMSGIPESFEFDSLPEDWDHLAPVIEAATARVPILGRTGIHTFFNGPESFTPDNRYHLGPAPALTGYWIAAGYNSVGIAGSGGAGMALAHWITEGHPPFDLWEVDVRRAHPFQRNRAYLQARVTETLGLLYADHYPFRQVATARGLRRSPLHDALLARGAVFGEAAGWERPAWFATPGQEARDVHDWGRQNWFANHRAEHLALRESVGLLDLSSFGKIRIEGADAERFCRRVFSGRVTGATGRIAYTHMLNDRGGIESDLTVTRLSETAFLAVTAAATLPRDLAWMRSHACDLHVTLTDTTSAEAVIAVMGPASRALLRKVSPDAFDAPFGTATEVEVGHALARAHRVSYVGELGWELYLPTEFAAHVLEVLLAHNPTLCGMRAMDSCRMEKGFRHWGHDITDEDHIVDAGLGFAVRPSDDDFIGAAAVRARQASGPQRRLVQVRLHDPHSMLFHNEALVRDGRIVGPLTSGAYGHTLGAAVGMGWAPLGPGETDADLLSSAWEVEVAGIRHTASASLAPFHDPTGARMRA